jgi:hypothetical protein
MNERIGQLAEQAGLLGPSSRIGNSHDATERFAELIVRECADVAGRDVGHFVLKHFEVKEQSTEPNRLHTCPYAEEIHNDYETLCDCDEEQQRQCAMDV